MNTPGEQLRDTIIEQGTEAVKKTAYAAGNSTENLNFIIKTATILESCRAGGTTMFKASRDYMRGDPLCLGLCVVSTACEGVAIISSTCKFIPHRRTIWLTSKGASQCLMRYRNLCSGEGC